MLAARSLPSICLSCRLKLLALESRNSVLSPAQRPLQSLTLPSKQPSRQGLRSFTQRRQLSSSLRNTENATESINHSEAIKQSADLREYQSYADIERSVRAARQTYGDTLPKGHLNEAEYVIYERLYGTPLLTDEAELAARATNAKNETIAEDELREGTHVLLRHNKVGELEEVEYCEDHPDDVADEAEAEFEFVEGRLSEAELEELAEEKAKDYHQKIYERTTPGDEGEETEEGFEAEEPFMRTHPLTAAGRFQSSPSTLHLPQENFVNPISSMLTRANHKHLSETAQKLFGGPGLPHSATTPIAAEGKEQKPIPIDPSQSDMGSIAGDAYMAAVMPGTYASVMSTLVEVRRRQGSAWLERLLRKEGGPLILDAGAGGAAVVAWREILHAEWLRMHEETGAISYGPAPVGKATVLTGSDVLRHRASKLLENTSFLPRLPDAVTAEDSANAQQPRKVYDIVIAPHALWSLRQEYQRKDMVQKLWSLLNPNGGVLLLIEKGLPRGFEVIAAARELLLKKHIASPDSLQIENRIQDQPDDSPEDTRFTVKETGMIIAPCTNHTVCPMYHTSGVATGRKDFCYFSQRYIRPPFLQRVLGAKERNHEDVQFSYLAVQRGRDQRLPEHDILGKGVVQGEDATVQAFEGHEFEHPTEQENGTGVSVPVNKTEKQVNPLTLPRMILPAIKRRGHIIIDVCTPSGSLERWTVPKSFSKQAYRDARKSQWGDLWALGAKTRIPKNVRLGRPQDEEMKKKGKRKGPRKNVIEIPVGDHGVLSDGARVKTGGRYALDRKNKKTGRKGRKQKPILLET